MDVSIIVPAYNEEQRLAATIKLYYSVVQQRYGSAFEMIVVANGCRDRTADVARAAQARYPQVCVVEVHEPIGKGGAVLEGFRHAQGNRVIFVDADGATAPSSMLALLDQLDQYDIAIGSRRLPSSRILRAQPLTRTVWGRCFALAVRTLFHLPFYDTQCGAKAFRQPAAKQLASLVEESRWAFDVDLLLCARALRLKTVEHPVIWSDQPGSQLRVGSTLREVVRSLWRIRRRHSLAGLNIFTAFQSKV